MTVVDDKEKNLKKAVSMIRSVAERCDFIVLPEMFTCPYSTDKFADYSEDETTSEVLQCIAKLAKEYGVYILAGSVPERDYEKIYNTSYLFGKDGYLKAKHRKMHLFDIDVKDKITFKESDVLSAGNSITVVDTDFGKIGIGICYDIRFMELSRIMVEKGALILFYPGAFNMTTGPAHWELLFKSRALDNQVFCVGTAPALNEDADYHSYGHSIVTDPWGDVLVEGDEKEQVIECEIDLDEIKKVREELPVLKNKRKDIYDMILLKLF